MGNPFNRDKDGDGVKQLDELRLITAILIAVVLFIVIAGFVSGPPTWVSGVFGAIEGTARFIGIFLCLPLIIFFFFYRRHLLKPKEDDSFTYAKRKKTAGRLLIVIIVLTVYMVITYVIWIITILAVAATR